MDSYIYSSWFGEMVQTELMRNLSSRLASDVYYRQRHYFSKFAALVTATLPVSRPAVSQHLRVLKEAGLVTERKDGTRRIYGVEPKAIGDLRAYFDSFWEQALAGFKAAAESEGRRA